MEPEIQYWPNGNKHLERYYQNGHLHRLNGPAWIDYYENGNIEYEIYCVNGKRHKLDGPAFIGYYVNESICYKSYWVNGNQIQQNEIEDILEQCGNDKQLLQDLLSIIY